MNKKTKSDMPLAAGTWTLRHDEYCLEHSIKGAARDLWHFLMQLGTTTEIEIDLVEFNIRVEKFRGKGYEPKWLKQIFNKLASLRIIQVVKKYTWAVYKVIVRPLGWLRPPKKREEKSYFRQQTSPFDMPKPQSVVEGENNSNHSSIPLQVTEEIREIFTACTEAGLHFGPDAEIFEYAFEDVRLALAYFQSKGGHSVDGFGRAKIGNPEGWVINCLRNRYWEKQSWSLDNLLHAFGFSP